MRAPSSSLNPTEMDTHQGESHDGTKLTGLGPGDLFSISGPAINKLGDLGQVTLSSSSNCKMSLDSSRSLLNLRTHQNHLGGLNVQVPRWWPTGTEVVGLEWEVACIYVMIKKANQKCLSMVKILNSTQEIKISTLHPQLCHRPPFHHA